MIALDQLVPAAHLLRKNDRYVDFDFIYYGLVEDLYCKSAKTVLPFTVAPPAKTIKKPLLATSGKTPWTSRKTTATPPKEKQNTNNAKKPSNGNSAARKNTMAYVTPTSVDERKWI